MTRAGIENPSPQDQPRRNFLDNRLVRRAAAVGLGMMAVGQVAFIDGSASAQQNSPETPIASPMARVNPDLNSGISNILFSIQKTEASQNRCGWRWIESDNNYPGNRGSLYHDGKSRHYVETVRRGNMFIYHGEYLEGLGVRPSTVIVQARDNRELGVAIIDDGQFDLAVRRGLAGRIENPNPNEGLSPEQANLLERDRISEADKYNPNLDRINMAWLYSEPNGQNRATSRTVYRDEIKEIARNNPGCS